MDGSDRAQVEKLTLDEYLGLYGLSDPMSDFMLDKMRNPHGLTLRQRKRLEKDGIIAANAYAEKRQAAIQEYNQKVNNGQIHPRSSIEVIIERARYGHPDNETTQAARRVCRKRGVDWEE